MVAVFALTARPCVGAGSGLGEAPAAEDERFTSVNAGKSRFCVLGSNAGVFCPGGARGMGELVPETKRFTEIASGSLHSCGIREGRCSRLLGAGRSRAGVPDGPDRGHAAADPGARTAICRHQRGQILYLRTHR